MKLYQLKLTHVGIVDNTYTTIMYARPSVGVKKYFVPDHENVITGFQISYSLEHDIQYLETHLTKTHSNMATRVEVEEYNGDHVHSELVNTFARLEVLLINGETPENETKIQHQERRKNIEHIWSGLEYYFHV